MKKKQIETDEDYEIFFDEQQNKKILKDYFDEDFLNDFEDFRDFAFR